LRRHPVNAITLEQTEKRTKFQQVARGACRHDEASLLEPVKTKGVGIKFTCSQCGHTWYINKKIKNCGCLTCKGTRRSSLERNNSRRTMRSTAENGGGPLWTRTTDPSLIRSVETAKKRTNRVNPADYFNAWYNEQGLKGTTKPTIGAYLGRVKDLLETHPNPSVFDIKEYLSQKQQAGFLSGTIANYIVLIIFR
jgi:hypothetical protein